MNIVSLYVPREGIEPRWRDYVPFLKVLQKSCDLLRLRHVVLTDDLSLPFETFTAKKVPINLMHATTYLQWKWCERGDWDDDDTLFVGADCLILKGPEAWAGDYDLAVTSRPGEPYQINTGAVMAREAARDKITELFADVHRFCGKFWCADQASVERALGPIPADHRIVERRGLRVNFLPMKGWNQQPRDLSPIDAAVAHFKGKTRKDLILPWAKAVLDLEP